MGPKATSVFFDRVIENTDASSDQNHIDMIILNHATLPDRTLAILENQESRFLEPIKKDIKLLESSGVTNIAIPCNTSHYFHKKMQSFTNVNIINMVQDTVEYIHNTYGRNSKVGILATNGTIKSGIYEREAEKYNVELYKPSRVVQNKVMNIIYQIKADANYYPTELETIINNLVTVNGCDSVILGCTELSSIRLNDSVKGLSIDPMDILVENSIILSGKQSISRKYPSHYQIS